MVSETEAYEDEYETESVTPAPAAEVTIDGPGVKITRSVDEATMASIIAILFGAAPVAALAGRGAPTDAPSHAGPGAVRGPAMWDEGLTLGEFLHETGAKTHPHRICATAYYLEEFRGVEYFNRDDIKAALVESREDLPQNLPRDWTTAISTNLITPKPGETDKFYVTKTGRRAVDSRFQDLPKRRANRRAPRKASSGSNGDTE